MGSDYAYLDDYCSHSVDIVVQVFFSFFHNMYGIFKAD